METHPDAERLADDSRPDIPGESRTCHAPFWQHIPAYSEVSEEQFLDHRWQARHSLTRPDKLLATVRSLVSEQFVNDAEKSYQRTPMSLRVSPYVLSLIDWSDPYRDPLRIQFIPLASRMLADHPKLGYDSLHEQADAPLPGLTHRYTDRALFLPLNTCPVYCRFCTRSYAVGASTEIIDKARLGIDEDRWQHAYQYIASRPELEDIVVSGGDAYQLKPRQIESIGMELLELPNIRRIRFGTKGPAVLPQKILSDPQWLDALTRVVERGRKLHKEVALHTHFNHPSEITWITRRAMDRICERGIFCRNQSVLQRGVNDTIDVMTQLLRQLGQLNVHPYYVYVHDLVKGVEDLRTTLQTALDLEKSVRGATAGFNTPVFVVDTAGGGGKRDAHSFEYYNRTTGVSVFTSPSVKPGQFFMYFDPIRLLPEEGQRRWADPSQQQMMIDEAIQAAQKLFH